MSFWSWICLPKFSGQQQTPFPYLPMFWAMCPLFSSSCVKLHPLKLFSGAQHLLTSVLLCGQEERKTNQPLLPSSLTLASRTPLHGVRPLCPPPRMEVVFPMVATGQRGSVTCAVEVILCKSTSEFRPVSINLLS